MRGRRRRLGANRARQVLLAVLSVGVVVGCQSSGEPSPSADQSVCDDVVGGIIAEVGAFVEPYADLTVEEFLARDAEGRAVELRSQLAAELAQADIPLDRRCSAEEVEFRLDEALDALTGRTPTIDFIVEVLRSGAEPAVRDVTIDVGDPVETILASLAPGSSISFGEGRFDLDATLFVSGELTIRGTGIATTELRSSAGQAALALFSDAALTLSDLTVTLEGGTGASGIVVVDASATLDRVEVRGARLREDQGGSGVLVVVENAPVDDSTAVVVRDSRLTDNEVSGIALSGPGRASIESTVIEDNAGCGICFLGGAGGEVRASLLKGNGVGIQIFDDGDPRIADTRIEQNAFSGVSVTDAARPVLERVELIGNQQVGIEIADDAQPELTEVSIAGGEVGIAVSGGARPVIETVEVIESEIGMQVLETAEPVVEALTVRRSSLAGLLVGGTSAGTFDRIEIEIGEDSTGFVVGGDSTVAFVSVVVDGAGIGASFGDSTVATVETLRIAGARIGLDVRDTAAPELVDVEIRDTIQGAMILAEQSRAQVLSASLFDVGQIGFQAGDQAGGSVFDLTIEGAELGALLTDETEVRLDDVTIRGIEVGVEIAGSAEPHLERVNIEAPSAVGVSVGGAARPELSGNRIVRAGRIGVQVVEDAAPVITETFVGGPVDAESLPADDPGALVVGILFAGTQGGSLQDSEIQGFPVGVQVGGRATPQITSNRIDAGVDGGVGLLFGDSAGGTASENDLVDQSIGIQIGGSANPEVRGNRIRLATDAGVLVTAGAGGVIAGTECRFEGPGIVLFDGVEPTLEDNRCQVIRTVSQ